MTKYTKRAIVSAVIGAGLVTLLAASDGASSALEVGMAIISAPVLMTLGQWVEDAR
jgi:hypothetical protein